MSWQPINTAPKDGTRILGFGLWAGEINGPEKEPQYCVICWQHDGRTDYAGYQWTVCGTDAYAAWLNPSHWMPLEERPW